jgi:hypothetical protein
MKDDPDTNIKFVQTVQMYPCLYDYRTKDYSNRNEQDKAWGEIGKIFDANSKEKRYFVIIIMINFFIIIIYYIYY